MDEMTLSPDAEMAIEQMLAEMRLLNEQMRRDQVEIDRLKSETALLKRQSDRLQAHTSATLERLKAAV